MLTSRLNKTLVAVLLASAAALSASAAAPSAPAALGAIPSWTQYHRDAQRSAVDPDTASVTTTSQPPLAWQSPDLDGTLTAEPLLYGSHVSVATENDTVYSLNAATGAIEWQNHLATPVPRSALPTQSGTPCGNIAPEGIVSTPVIDPTTNAIYAVEFSWDGTHATHELVALDLNTGQRRPGFPFSVEPSYPTDPGVSPNGPVYQYQRPALALDGNNVVIGFGSNDDCDHWWGWVVSAPKDGVGGVGAEHSYQVEAQSGHYAGGIWGAGNGPTIDASGNIFVATGNAEGASGYDYSSSVLKLDSNLNLIGNFAPSDWATLDTTDLDVGSSAPLPLPGGLLFQGGKTGVGYLLSAASLGGIGGEKFSATICDPPSSGQPPGEIFGGGVYVPKTATTGKLFVACHFGMRAVDVDTAAPSFTLTSPWHLISLADGPPIFAAGLVWSVGFDDSHLFGINPATGDKVADIDLGQVPHFATPSAGGGRLFVAARSASNQPQIRAYTIGSPSSPTTTTSLQSSANPSLPRRTVVFTASISPAPYAGTVAFTDGGPTIPGCDAVPVASDGTATCSATYDRIGAHQIAASYSGDPFYTGSNAAALTQRVAVPPDVGHVQLTRDRFRARSGTTLTLYVAEPATVSFVASQSVPGRRLHGHCVAGRKHGSRCTRSVVRLSLRLTATAGNNSLKLDTSALKPGRYDATVSARDANGAKSRPVPLSFQVVR